MLWQGWTPLLTTELIPKRGLQHVSHLLETILPPWPTGETSNGDMENKPPSIPHNPSRAANSSSSFQTETIPSTSVALALLSLCALLNRTGSSWEWPANSHLGTVSPRLEMGVQVPILEHVGTTSVLQRSHWVALLHCVSTSTSARSCSPWYHCAPQQNTALAKKNGARPLSQIVYFSLSK